MRTNGIDPATLQAALIGYELQRESIEGKIAEVRKQLGGRASERTAAATAQPPTKRKLSAAARKRIAAAQRKRWRAYKKAKGTQ